MIPSSLKPLFSSIALLFIAQLMFAQALWVPLNVNTSGNRMDDLFFLDDSTAWTVNGGGQIFKTIDQGTTWTLQLQDTLYFRSVRFFDQNHGFAGTLDGVILESKDGGDSWQRVDNIPDSLVGVCGMHYPTDSVGYFTGAYWGDPYLLTTKDRGVSWSHKDMEPYFSHPNNEWNCLVDVHFFDEDEGVICGRTGPDGRGVIFRTENGGKSWDEVWRADSTNCEGDCRIWKLFFLSKEIGYASVEDFRSDLSNVLKTTDGGKTWTSMPMNIPPGFSPLAFQAVGFLNEYIGWVGGQQAGLWATTDGGLTWAYDNSGTNYNRFVRINNGLIFGSGSLVYRYSDTTALGIANSPAIPRQSSLRAFPIPCKADLNIQYEMNHPGHLEVTIYRTDGQLMKIISEGFQKLGSVSLKADVRDLSPGQYFVAVYTNEGYEVQQFIKE